ncbi:MAG: hypothetical protein HQL88_10215 [Magnetococcales bacterium]|nr:hypothetical protein [Magnetococcales bacterium]
MAPSLSPQEIPLVRTIPLEELYECLQKNGGDWFLSSHDPSRVGHRLLENCRAVRADVFEPCLYFFAGKVYPDVDTTPIVFVYAPAIEEGRRGSVSPFDTGGLWCRHMHPHCDQPTACQLIADTARPLQEWREAFTLFVEDFFAGTLRRYLEREAPTPAPTLRGSWPAELPVRNENNWHLTVHGRGRIRESRAWTWEIRLQQSSAVLDALLFASASPTTADALGMWVTEQREEAESGDSPPNADKKQAVERAAALWHLLRRPPPGSVDPYDTIIHVEKTIAAM